MTATIELSHEIEADLAALAKARGLGLPQYVQHVLKERIFVCTSATERTSGSVALFRQRSAIKSSAFRRLCQPRRHYGAHD
jgi:hypothetical protein